MNYTNCNLCYPKLNVSPSYGDAIRYHAELPSETSHHHNHHETTSESYDTHDLIKGINNYGEEFKEYLSNGTLQVNVDWGKNHGELAQHIIQSCYYASSESSSSVCKLRVHITVHGIGKRPAMKLIASNSVDIDVSSTNNTTVFPPFGVNWRHGGGVNNTSEETSSLNLYPEYLVKLHLQPCQYQTSIILGDITRHLHVAPPPIGRLNFHLSDVIWAPNLFRDDQARANVAVDSILARKIKRGIDGIDDATAATASEIQGRRRGFGLELETVSLPPDYENDCFTHQQQFVQTIERAREWHLTRLSDSNNEYNDQEDDVIKSVNEMYDGLLLWQVSHDLYVENSAAPTRLDLYQQIMEHINSENRCDLTLSNDEEAIRTLNELVLGGRVEIPQELLDGISILPNQNIPTSQASPEYKSPAPPNELYHTFPPPQDGHDNACDSIRLFLDGVIKNQAASNRTVAVPTVSDIGQSGSSIHVHVNINNPNAWPREDLVMQRSRDLDATSSLLSVIFGWICFDRVIGNYFNMPNVWRDRSFAPMYATGPEFSWNEPSWKHGSSTIQPEQVKHVKLNNLQAWFEHVHSSLKPVNDEEKKEQEEPPLSLFETVFDHEVLMNTISRWNSLNLLSLKQYGTIEFRRCHATLNSDFVSAWTWFCVGFVEKFSQASMFDTFLYPFIGDGTSIEVGLQRLVDAQNHATIEDLFSVMCDGKDPYMPRGAFEKLICCKQYIKDVRC